MEREGDMVREVRDGRGYMERARKRGGKEREGKQERERERGQEGNSHCEKRSILATIWFKQDFSVSHSLLLLPTTMEEQ